MTDANQSPSSFQPARLGALQQQVMETLWDHGPLTVREIIDRLPTQPAYTTIATVLGNLERKGLTRAARDGRTVRHQAEYSRQEHAALWMEHALGTSDDRAASILRFVDAMPPDDVALLRDYLRRGETEDPT